MFHRVIFTGLSAATAILLCQTASADPQRLQGQITRYDSGGVYLQTGGSENYVPYGASSFFVGGNQVNLEAQNYPIGTPVEADFDSGAQQGAGPDQGYDGADPAYYDSSYGPSLFLGGSFFWGGGYYGGHYYNRGYYNHSNGGWRGTTYNSTRASSPTFNSGAGFHSGATTHSFSSGYQSGGFHGSSSTFHGGGSFHGSGGGFHGGGGGHGGGHR